MADSFENLEHLKLGFTEPQTFNVNGVTYARITDSNYSVYSNGQLRYNVQSLYSSSSSEKPVYELCEAYCHIPITNQLTLTDATFPDGANAVATNVIPLGIDSRQNIFQVHNKNALALKDPLALINQYWFTMANQEVITSPTHSYFYNLLKLRCESKEELEKKMSVIDRILDNGQSMIRDSAVGEINNINSEYVAKNVFGLDESNNKNMKYGKKFVPYGKDGTSTGLLEVSNFSEDDLIQLEIPYMKWIDATNIVFYDIVKIYLKDVDDFFKNCPSLLQIPKFNLTINTNISDSTSWTVTYSNSTYKTSAKSNPLVDAVGTGTAGVLADANAVSLSDAEVFNQIRTLFTHYFHPSKVVASMGNATCCPWLIGDAGLSKNNSLGNALMFIPDDTKTAVSLKITSRIGWWSGTTNNKNQTYLIVPQVMWNPDIQSSIIKNEPYNFYVKKATIDMNTFTGLDYKKSSIKKPLNNSWSRVRNIYLVPFSTDFGLSTGPANALVKSGVRPYESPLSSAPLTNSNIYLSRVQIWQGGKPLLPVENNYSPIDMYDNQLFRVLNEMGGNNSLSVQSGMVDKYDWKGAYHYYKYDLSKFNSDSTADNVPKSYEIGFDINSKSPPSNANDSKNTCDVIVIIEYEASYSINRFTGEFSSPFSR